MSISAKVRPIMRLRLLLGVVALLLVMWGIKAVHHALQPKYQGKTMGEWFEASYSADVLVQRGYPSRYTSDDPAVEAMRHFGTDAVHYLWKECRREEFRVVVQCRDFWQRHVLKRTSTYNFDPQIQRRVRAEALLIGVRSNAQVLVPELVAQVDGSDIDKSTQAAAWLGTLRIAPGESVPALMRALTEPQRIPPVNCSIYAFALGRFKLEAAGALPLLLKLYDDPAVTGRDNHHLAAAIIQIDSHRPVPEHLERVLDPHDSGLTIMALLIPARNGELPVTVLPQVRILAGKVTDPRHKQHLTNVIGILEKQSKP